MINTEVFLDTVREVISVNPYYVIILLMLGAVLKHLMPKVNNNTIPVILIIVGCIIGILFSLPLANAQEGLQAAVCGICSGAFAVGIHQSGKTLNFLRGNKITL